MSSYSTCCLPSRSGCGLTFYASLSGLRPVCRSGTATNRGFPMDDLFSTIVFEFLFGCARKGNATRVALPPVVAAIAVLAGFALILIIPEGPESSDPGGRARPCGRAGRFAGDPDCESVAAVATGVRGCFVFNLLGAWLCLARRRRGHHRASLDRAERASFHGRGMPCRRIAGGLACVCRGRTADAALDEAHHG